MHYKSKRTGVEEPGKRKMAAQESDMRSRPTRDREPRPGVSGPGSSGQTASAVGRKRPASLGAKKHLPGPFNHEWTEGLVKIGIKLAKDPSFCNVKVLLFML